VITSSRGLPVGSYNYVSRQVGHVIRYPERVAFLEVPIVPEIPVRLLCDFKYDLVHIHGMTPLQSDLSLLASKLSKAKIVYTHHFDPQTRGGHLTTLYSYVGKCAVGLADAITASTRSYAESSNFLKPFLRKVTVIPMGVNSSQFSVATLHHSMFESFPRIDSFEGRVLFVGKLIYYKGLDYLLHAFSQMKTSRTCLIVVGDGGERERLTRLARQLRITDRVFFLGAVPDSQLPFVYSIADVVVLPSISRREAFGIVLLEAMAAGKPVVASAIPGVSEVVLDGRTGYLVPPRDPIALAAALDSILQDRSIARRMSDEAKRVANSRYDWEHVCKMYFDLYEEKLNSETRPPAQPTFVSTTLAKTQKSFSLVGLDLSI
jgi:rhamnosyl/mannosyltransferase